MAALALQCVFVLCFLNGVIAKDWSYHTKDSWPMEFPLHCAGRQQSPISIITRETTMAWWTIFTPFKFTDYLTVPTSMTAVNNHHTLSVTAAYKTKPRIRGGGLSGSYEFLNNVVADGRL
ncbi:uncharacterized protein LOC125177915, partial [Hyalella azteca]|uniref:Uncharacterized protein LOC125177915 n=1 Tax=Hyalella azteca TaxID=294128 RepID=A0A979FJZ0_HYAAZ